MSLTESDNWSCVVCGSNKLPHPQRFVSHMPVGECMQVTCERCGSPDIVTFVGSVHR